MKKKLKQMIRVTEDFQLREQIILRDHLAMERTKLANERTLLSYIRTSLYLLLGGLALIGLKNNQDLIRLGYVSISMSVILLVIGVYRFHQLKRYLKRIYVDNDGRIELKEENQD